MGFDLHTIRVVKGSTLSRLDSLIAGLLPQQAYNKANGTVASIGAGTPGAGYQTIPTVAINTPASGAKHTGSGAAAAAVMEVLSATINAPGSGYTTGSQTLTGSDGTGTKFQLTVTVAGGVVTGVTAVAVAGAYTAMPTVGAAPVTGGGGTGATFVLNMGVASYTVGSAGTHYPDGSTTAAVSGGTPTTPAVPGVVAITSAAGDIVTWDVAGLTLPVTYGVQVSVDQDAVAYISNRTQNGFTVTLSPRLAANTLASGKADLLLVA